MYVRTYKNECVQACVLAIHRTCSTTVCANYTRLCLHCYCLFPSSSCILPPVVVVGCVVYAYAWVVAALVWGFFWWRAGTSSFSFLHTLCMYGYSLSGYNLYLVSHWVGPIHAVMYIQYVIVHKHMCLHTYIQNSHIYIRSCCMCGKCCETKFCELSAELKFRIFSPMSKYF